MNTPKLQTLPLISSSIVLFVFIFLSSSFFIFHATTLALAQNPLHEESLQISTVRWLHDMLQDAHDMVEHTASADDWIRIGSKIKESAEKRLNDYLAKLKYSSSIDPQHKLKIEAKARDIYAQLNHFQEEFVKKIGDKALELDLLDYTASFYQEQGAQQASDDYKQGQTPDPSFMEAFQLYKNNAYKAFEQNLATAIAKNPESFAKISDYLGSVKSSIRNSYPLPDSFLKSTLASLQSTFPQLLSSASSTADFVESVFLNFRDSHPAWDSTLKNVEDFIDDTARKISPIQAFVGDAKVVITRDNPNHPVNSGVSQFIEPNAFCLGTDHAPSGFWSSIPFLWKDTHYTITNDGNKINSAVRLATYPPLLCRFARIYTTLVIDRLYEIKVIRKLFGIIQLTRVLIQWFCECSDDFGCPLLSNQTTLYSRSQWTTSSTPFRKPCLVFENYSLAKSTQVATVFNPKYPIATFTGSSLLILDNILATSRIFHYMIGFFFGSVASLLLLVVYLYKRARSLVPSQIMVVADAALVLTPTIGIIAFGNKIPNMLTYVKSLLINIIHSRPGQFIVFIGGLVGLFFTWKNRLFLPDKADKLEVQVENLQNKVYNQDQNPALDSDGGLDDEDDQIERIKPISQIVLKYLLDIVGFLLLLNSTSNPTASILFAGSVIFRRPILDLRWNLHMWWYSQKPGAHSNLITKDQYQKQAQSYTKLHLRQLRKQLNDNPQLLMKVKETNEIRLRRFAAGQPHIIVQEDEDDDQQKRTCTIQ